MDEALTLVRPQLVLMLLTPINIIPLPGLNGIFVKSIDTMLGSVDTLTRIPLGLKPRLTIFVTGTVIGSFLPPPAVVANNFELIVLAVPAAKEFTITKRAAVTEAIPMRKVIDRTETLFRAEDAPTVRPVHVVEAVAIVEAAAITANRGSPRNGTSALGL